VLSVVGTINGTISHQVTITSANAAGNIGSPGTAIIFPINAYVNNPELKTWTLAGSTLKFDVLPNSNIEIFSLTGSKVAKYLPAKEITLELNKGLYLVRFDDKASKILIK